MVWSRKALTMVLNALSGDFINIGFENLVSNGRFVEIGKNNIWSKEDAQKFRNDVLYMPFDYSEVFDADPELKKKTFDEFQKLVDSGDFSALPIQTFDSTHIEDAVSCLRHAKHIGKVVISLPDFVIPETPLSVIKKTSHKKESTENKYSKMSTDELRVCVMEFLKKVLLMQLVLLQLMIKMYLWTVVWIR